ncbi:MAG TPA: response regulator [Burkholderiaceae bacterium]|nr:response regulator [Burkholderiaceae bacterium]
MKEPDGVVHLVDDDRSFRTAAERLLRGHGFVVHGFAAADQLLAAISADTRGCVIADLRMPGMNGLELQDALAGTGSRLPIVFLTGAADIASTVRAMRSGAEDFLEKRCPEAHLVAAVQRALERDASARAERERLQALRARFQALSRREREVLSHVLRGRMNKQIAADLGIHERTVKLHRTAMTTKLAVHSGAELVRLAQAAGLLDGDGTTFPNGK